MATEVMQRTAGWLAVLAGLMRIGLDVWFLGRALVDGVGIVFPVGAFTTLIVYGGLQLVGGWWLLRGDSTRLLWGTGLVLGLGVLAAVGLIFDVLAATVGGMRFSSFPTAWVRTAFEAMAVTAAGLSLRAVIEDPGATWSRLRGLASPIAGWLLVLSAAAIGLASQGPSWLPAEFHAGSDGGMFGRFAQAQGWLQIMMVVSILALTGLGIAAATARPMGLGVAIGAVVVAYAFVGLVGDVGGRSMVAGDGEVEPTLWLPVKVAAFVVLVVTLMRVRTIERR